MNTDIVLLFQNPTKSVALIAECEWFYKTPEAEWKTEAHQEILKPRKKGRNMTILMEMIADYMKSDAFSSKQTATDEAITPLQKKIQ